MAPLHYLVLHEIIALVATAGLIAPLLLAGAWLPLDCVAAPPFPFAAVGREADQHTWPPLR